jgi:hypothetical protein
MSAVVYYNTGRVGVAVAVGNKDTETQAMVMQYGIGLNKQECFVF